MTGQLDMTHILYQINVVLQAMNLEKEIAKRKTFAIISHPDAGKTTLTEKLLLFGGAIQVAGAVKSNKIKKGATSDFMEIERQRGISVATSVMTFLYSGKLINILDTPGHKDFAEDTFRTLTAVDSVILVIDCVKGVEEQTERLMEVCRMRKTPVIVFVNKLDRDGKDPLDLLDELEQKLKINVRPITWPINMGRDFQGVYHLLDHSYRRFVAGTRGEDSELFDVEEVSTDFFSPLVGEKNAQQLSEDVELIEGVYEEFEKKDYLSGDLAPVFFGSAVNNFGVQELLDTFVNIAPSPLARETTAGEIQPNDEKFSGFVFKIHANLDPKHRDRLAFLRVCSGSFARNTFYHHVRLDKNLRFSNPYSFLAREKEIIENAYPGDVIGLYDAGNFKIGDTLTEGEDFYYTGIPSFSPEMFRELVNDDPMKTKQLDKGVSQLMDEGVAQLFSQHEGRKKIIGCVGELQFEVIKYRLLQEYGASCSFRPLNFYKACWISGEKEKLDAFIKYKPELIARDKDDRLVYLAQSEWYLNTEMTNNPDINFQFASELLS